MKARSVILAVVVGLLAFPPLSGAAESEGLFREPGSHRLTEVQREGGRPHQDGVLRSRPVGLERALLPSAEALPPTGQRLRLNLFADATVNARITRVEHQARGTAWIGRVQGEEYSNVVMIERDGIMAASVVWSRGIFRVGWDGSGQVVEELDQERLTDDGCEADAGRLAEAAATADLVAGDDGSTIDVLVVYTQAARAAAGGTAGMLAQIDVAITETNTGYADSGVIQRLRLAGTQEVTYTETVGNMGTDLSRVRGTSDGFIDSVHALRDSLNADMVSLIGAGYTGGSCGIAYVGNATVGFAPNAFSVVNRSCMTGYYSFGHELGHNMGLAHDRANAGVLGAHSYSFGYRDPSHLFRTVLAYNCPVNCTRVLHFSNPNVTEVGQPTGIIETAPDSAYNALSLNNSRTATANWRDSASEPPFGTIDTPAAGASGLAGAIPVTGWALDDVEVTRVDVWRDPVGGETPAANGKIYIGDATFVRGARPDVESAYPSHPNADRAGWGYMLLTNFLPSAGNGNFTLHAYAWDGDGQSTLLSSKTVSVDNASSTTPFGTLDTPTQGGTISGNAYLVWGWALTPVPGMVPTDGSTIWVYVDGAPLGHPIYNLYRSDIATLFPGYANSGGAVGYYTLDTTTLSNGIHTIAWSVTDDLGRVQGIGSRYFWVSN